jgi:hypothetical protein
MSLSFEGGHNHRKDAAGRFSREFAGFAGMVSGDAYFSSPPWHRPDEYSEPPLGRVSREIIAKSPIHPLLGEVQIQPVEDPPPGLVA